VNIYILLAVLGIIGFLAVAKSKHKGGQVSGSSATPPHAGWYIGPIVRGTDYSQGMPKHPTMQGAGWIIDLPLSGGVDAVINPDPPSYVGARAITARYRVTGGDFLATDENNEPGRVGICIQRRGDDWSGKGKYQQYRLYGTDRPLLVAGEGQLSEASWTDVEGQPVSQDVVDAVLADLAAIMVCFGGSSASHGVYATQPSTFTLIEPPALIKEMP
jgi:hypothetical protein